MHNSSRKIRLLEQITLSILDDSLKQKLFSLRKDKALETITEEKPEDNLATDISKLKLRNNS